MIDMLPSPKRAADYGLPNYFDMQAKMGHTKHLGGANATVKLAENCQLNPEKTLLYVGSGAGLSAIFIAQNFGCRVVGVDILPEMVKSAQRWADKKGLADQMEFQVGDAQDLPFEDNQFDAAMSESVNIFVPDKEKAISEYVRVVKPGGYVAMNEAIWVNNPSQKMREVMVEATKQQFQEPEFWETLLRDGGLVDIVVENNAMKIREESRSQTKLVRGRDYLRMLGIFFKLIFTDRETRKLMKYISSDPRGYFKYMGYGLYVGRKPK